MIRKTAPNKRWWLCYLIGPEGRESSVAVYAGSEFLSAVGFGRKSLEQGIECGKALIRAKELCAHGEWLSLLTKHKVSVRSAQRFMALGKESNTTNLSHLVERTEVEESPQVQSPQPVTPIVRPVQRFQCRPCRVNGQKADCKECADLNNEVRRPIEWSDPTLVISPGPSTETYTRDPEPFPEEREETADPATLSYKGYKIEITDAIKTPEEPVQPPTIVPASEPVSVEDLFDGCDFLCGP